MRRVLGDEDGAAALEFIGVGLLLLVPLVYLVVALGQLQAASLGVESGARHVARGIALADDPADAERRGDELLRTTIEEYGLDPATTEVGVQCRPATVRCPEAGATIVVTVSSRVTLPLVPSILGLERVASLEVAASAVQKVSRFWDGT